MKATGDMTRDDPFKTVTRDTTPLKREEVTGMLSLVLKKLFLRATADRFRSKADDEMLLRFSRTVSQVAAIHNQVLRDGEIEQLEQRLAALEGRK